jgi:DNA modification methylase
MPGTNIIENIFEQVTERLNLVEPKTVSEGRKFINANFDALLPKASLKDALYSSISKKLKINENKLRKIYSFLSSEKITLDYHNKNRLEKCYVNRDFSYAEDILSSDIIEFLSREYSFFTDEEIVSFFKSEISAPLNRRTKVFDNALSTSLATAIFSEYVFNCIPLDKACFYFDENHEDDYIIRVSKEIDYFDNSSPTLCIGHFHSGSCYANDIKKFTCDSYQKSRNHGYMSIILEMDSNGMDDRAWSLALDAIVFSEKSFASNINYKFFKPKTIKSSLLKHVPSADLSHVDFSTAHFGYQYLDCFYVDNTLNDRNNFIVLLFELNHFSEEKIPCPACRTSNVQGNSYSKLGVKSWECNNLICPDRSRTNRGKRFSLYSIIRQHALFNSKNILEPSIVKKWNRDVVVDCTFEDIFEMLIRFYSEVTDIVTVYTEKTVASYSRNVITRNICKLDSVVITKNDTTLNNYASKFIFDSNSISGTHQSYEEIYGHKLYLGDSNIVVNNLNENSIDVAVTSPPYYNAKEYAQWPNIYAYLHDMFLNASGVFNSLNNGGLYFFNIFDYFDNENDIVFSAMGKKRLILSSQIKMIFEKIGFTFLGNIIWDKGHIEGKRGFNGGNYAPFFQHPFNCWEHVLIFSKGCPEKEIIDSLPSIINEKPVFKIIKGQNTYGHTAPYPLAIPNLALKGVRLGCTVLDPYSGSFTTSVSAERNGHKSIGVEWDLNYFELGKSRLREEVKQP